MLSDLEADSYYRYKEKVCLLQFSLPDRDYLFDPLEHELPSELFAALCGEGPRLLMHGADFDVRLFKRDFGLPLGPLFDTQIAARFLGKSKTGLAALLEGELDISIDKKEQRSDWSQRPLSEQQLEYAQRDTRHLHDLVAALSSQLEEAGRLHWVEEECALLRKVEPSKKEFDPEGWRKIKGTKDLKERGRLVISALYRWREAEAERLDRAPFRVAQNHVLLQAGLRSDKYRGVPDPSRWRFVPRNIDLDTWRQVIRAGLMEPDPGPKKRRGKAPPPPTPQVAERIEALKALRKQFAESLKLETGLVLPSSLLTNLARAGTDRALEDVEGMTEWRMEAMGSALALALTV